MRLKDSDSLVPTISHDLEAFIAGAHWAGVSEVRSYRGSGEWLRSDYPNSEQRGRTRKLWTALSPFIILFACFFSSGAQVPQDLLGQNWRATVAEDGLRDLEFFTRGAWQRYPFNTGHNGGPRLWVGSEKKNIFLQSTPTAFRFEGRENELIASILYLANGPRLGVAVTLKNAGDKVISNLRFGLQLGVDAYMDRYPEWNDKLFPTLLRCEKTHFFGYFMSPSGSILTISSPDPIASFERGYIGSGHRIRTVSLDLIQPGPLPSRHTTPHTFLNPGEERRWSIYFEGVSSLSDVKPALAAATRAPIIDADLYTVHQPQLLPVRLYSQLKPEPSVVNPDGEVVHLHARKIRSGIYETNFPLKSGFGIYKLLAASNGRVSEASFTLARPFSWYLLRAREASLKYQQKASSHIEGAYGFFSAFLGRKYFPDPALDETLDARFQEVLALLYDDKMQPGIYPERIQNSAGYCSLLVDRYEATGDRQSLEKAVLLADFIISRQKADGGFYNRTTHFTSVIYIAKSIMELMRVEKQLADSGETIWTERYARHYEAVKRAMDDLVRRRGNVQTEGEITFEDGMMSCSALQLGMFALMQKDAAQRAKYREAAIWYLTLHNCLTQLLIPDSRMNGATLRFWESQYDVMVYPNMMDSPHGWSAWRIYATYYIYLLTGDPQYLRMTMNALGSCLQLVDTQTGKLRWAFIADPYIEAKVFIPDAARSGYGRFVSRVVGEQYLDMVSDWWRAPRGKVVGGYVGHRDEWGPGGACDNDVHEIFKAMEEVALNSAFVVIDPNRQIEAWNCRVRRQGKLLEVFPAEAIVNRVHVNTRGDTKVRIHFPHKAVERTVNGLEWITE